MNCKALLPDVPTLAGHGVQWVLIGTTNWGAGLFRLSLFRSMTNNTPTASAVVASFGGNSQIGCAMMGLYLTNVVTTGNQGAGAVVQVVQTTNNSANPVVTLAALGAGAAIVAVFGNNVNGFGATSIDAGWTQRVQNGFATPSTGQLTIYSTATSDNTPSITDGAQSWGGIAVEIARAACP